MKRNPTQLVRNSSSPRVTIWRFWTSLGSGRDTNTPQNGVPSILSIWSRWDGSGRSGPSFWISWKNWRLRWRRLGIIWIWWDRRFALGISSTQPESRPLASTTTSEPASHANCIPPQPYSHLVMPLTTLFIMSSWSLPRSICPVWQRLIRIGWQIWGRCFSRLRSRLVSMTEKRSRWSSTLNKWKKKCETPWGEKKK